MVLGPGSGASAASPGSGAVAFGPGSGGTVASGGSVRATGPGSGGIQGSAAGPGGSGTSGAGGGGGYSRTNSLVNPAGPASSLLLPALLQVSIYKTAVSKQLADLLKLSGFLASFIPQFHTLIM